MLAGCSIFTWLKRNHSSSYTGYSVFTWLQTNCSSNMLHCWFYFHLILEKLTVHFVRFAVDSIHVCQHIQQITCVHCHTFSNKKFKHILFLSLHIHDYIIVLVEFLFNLLSQPTTRNFTVLFTFSLLSILSLFELELSSLPHIFISFVLIDFTCISASNYYTQNTS